jgi:hypothetical protein
MPESKTVSDERLAKLLKDYSEVGDWTGAYMESHAELLFILTELQSLRRSSSRGVVKVKGLEWVENVADTSIGAYWIIAGIDGQCTLGLPIRKSGDWPKYPTHEEAKAAAQTDFERRIVSALSAIEQEQAEREKPNVDDDALYRCLYPYVCDDGQTRILIQELRTRFFPPSPPEIDEGMVERVLDATYQYAETQYGGMGFLRNPIDRGRIRATLSPEAVK